MNIVKFCQTNSFGEKIKNFVQHYDPDKHWKRREMVINPNNNINVFLKYYYLYYIKKTDSYHNCSFGTNMNSGATFKTPPILPHGPNGIIIGHDCVIGANCKIFQQVTIIQGNGIIHTVIGDNVMLGAGAKILAGVNIGNNVKVGANCVVIENIPDNATVVLPKPIIHIK